MNVCIYVSMYVGLFNLTQKFKIELYMFNLTQKFKIE